MTRRRLACLVDNLRVSMLQLSKEEIIQLLMNHVDIIYIDDVYYIEREMQDIMGRRPNTRRTKPY